MNAPFQWTKQVASHFGGTRNPIVVHWPKGIQAKGELRTQFHHVIDVVPTMLEVAGIPEPKIVNGVTQKPIEGVSMLYSFDNEKAKSRRNCAVFRNVRQPRHLQRRLDGDNPPRPPALGDCWRSAGNFDQDPWELYNIDKDFSQADNLAAKNPEKLKELQAAFLVEAKKYNVLPLDDRMAERFDTPCGPIRSPV